MAGPTSAASVQVNDPQEWHTVAVARAGVRLSQPTARRQKRAGERTLVTRASVLDSAASALLNASAVVLPSCESPSPHG